MILLGCVCVCVFVTTERIVELGVRTKLKSKTDMFFLKPKNLKSHLTAVSHGVMVDGRNLLVFLSEMHMRPFATSYTTIPLMISSRFALS